MSTGKDILPYGSPGSLGTDSISADEEEEYQGSTEMI